jgi:biopolymer transport protein ExbB/TolQ
MTTTHRLLLALAFCAAVTVAQAQAPVEDRSSLEQAVQRSQLKSGNAYRDLQQARHEAKLAEQDFLNAQETYRAARKHADEAKRKLDAASKGLGAARAREARARKTYDAALGGVDKAFQKPPAK